MKLREVTAKDVAQFGRIPGQDDSLIPVIMAAAQSYVLSYTGVSGFVLRDVRQPEHYHGQ